jgi:hypothetical protein
MAHFVDIHRFIAELLERVPQNAANPSPKDGVIGLFSHLPIFA